MNLKICLLPLDLFNWSFKLQKPHIFSSRGMSVRLAVMQHCFVLQVTVPTRSNMRQCPAFIIPDAFLFLQDRLRYNRQLLRVMTADSVSCSQLACAKCLRRMNMADQDWTFSEVAIIRNSINKLPNRFRNRTRRVSPKRCLERIKPLNVFGCNGTEY